MRVLERGGGTQYYHYQARIKSYEEKAGTRKLEEENMKKALSLLKANEVAHLDLNEVLHGHAEGAIKRKRKGLKRPEGTITKRKRISKGGEEGIGLLATQQATIKSESEKKKRKVKVWSLPLLVLERVFSYLDWKDLGAVMLVCRRWSNAGGHPSLWTGFPLQLTGPRRLKSFSKIRRLGWIKSVTVTPLPGRELENCDAIVKHFGRLEELFVNGSDDGVNIRACHFWVKMENQTASGKYVCMSHPGTTNI